MPGRAEVPIGVVGDEEEAEPPVGEAASPDTGEEAEKEVVELIDVVDSWYPCCELSPSKV
jgi:hypothetical protein